MLSLDLLLKIAAIGIGLGILHTILAKSGKEEFATLATLAGVVIVFLMMFSLVFDVFRSVQTLFNL